MARPRTPTKILELKGAFTKNPQRARYNEPVPTGVIGDCPDEFDNDQKKAWDDIVFACAYGVLTSSDRLHVEITAKLIAKIREDEKMDMKAVSLALNYLGRLGLNPSERSKVSCVAEDKEKSKWAK